MIKEWLKGIDDKNRYSWNRDYKSEFCDACILTGLGLLSICLLIPGVLRWIGVSNWFMEHYYIRGLIFIILGCITALMASTYGSKDMKPENNKFVLDFMFIPIITSLTLLMAEAWWIFFVCSLSASGVLLFEEELGEKWYFKMSVYAAIASPIVYLIIAFIIIGFSVDSLFDIFFGAIFSFKIPMTMLKIVAVAYSFEEKPQDRLEEFFYNKMKQSPNLVGYACGYSVFLQSFLNIGDFMQEVSAPSNKR